MRSGSEPDQRALLLPGLRWRFLWAILLLAASVSAMAQPAALTGEDLEFGRAQVERMLADRPVLAETLVPDDPLLVWARARFAGAASGMRIAWDPNPPPNGIEAQHGHEPRTAIRVHPRHQSGRQAGQLKGASDHWADIVFELHNVAQRPAFEAAWTAVNEGRASLTRWLEEVARAEHRSLLYSRAFHRTRWRPWMRQRDLPHLSLRWRQILAVPTQFDVWIRRYGDGEDYPYRDYGHAWEAVQQQLRATGADWRIDPFELPQLRAAGSGR